MCCVVAGCNAALLVLNRSILGNKLLLLWFSGPLNETLAHIVFSAPMIASRRILLFALGPFSGVTQRYVCLKYVFVSQIALLLQVLVVSIFIVCRSYSDCFLEEIGRWSSTHQHSLVAAVVESVLHRDGAGFLTLLIFLDT